MVTNNLLVTKMVINNLVIFSVSDKTSYHKILPGIEAVRFVLRIVCLFWNLTFISAATSLSNFKAISSLYSPTQQGCGGRCLVFTPSICLSICLACHVRFVACCLFHELYSYAAQIQPTRGWCVVYHFQVKGQGHTGRLNFCDLMGGGS